LIEHLQATFHTNTLFVLFFVHHQLPLVVSSLSQFGINQNLGRLAEGLFKVARVETLADVLADDHIFAEEFVKSTRLVPQQLGHKAARVVFHLCAIGVRTVAQVQRQVGASREDYLTVVWNRIKIIFEFSSFLLRITSLTSRIICIHGFVGANRISERILKVTKILVFNFLVLFLV
jgi:hypothetical protein